MTTVGRARATAAARATLLTLSSVLCAGARADDASPFVRSRSVDGVTSFETATRTYRRANGDGPVVSLVGVVHIGDRAYYDALVATLASSEIVLYESVLPRGAFGTVGATDLERQRRTQDAMLFLRELLERFQKANGALPTSRAQWRAFVVGRDSRLARPFDLACRDGWNRELRLEFGEANTVLASRGADGVEGGTLCDLDLVLECERAREGAPPAGASPATTAPSPAAKSEPRRDLYGELAAALGVSLQVRSIDYDRAGWEPADLPMEELLDRLWKRGEKSVTLEMLSNDNGLAQGVVRFLLSIVSDSPAFKKLVVKALASGGSRGDSALGGVDQRIIIDERNDAVIEQLAQLLASPAASSTPPSSASSTPPRSVAIFYGAAHMRDFEETLRRDFGLEPCDASWQTAMSVDEWDAAKISARLEQFRDARAAVLANDPLGAYPEVARIDGRIAALEARVLLQRRAPAPRVE